MTAPTVVVVGVGNPDRGDDGAGPAVVARLGPAVGPGTALVIQCSDPTRVVDDWTAAEAAYVVDACRSGAPPGTVRRIEVGDEPVARRAGGSSSHGFDIATSIELARALGRLPRRLIVFSIEGEHFGLGGGLSPPVEAATRTVADRILDETGTFVPTERGSPAAQ